MGMTYQRGAVWWVKYYRNGRPIRESSGSSKESDAINLLKIREGDIAHGLPVNPKLNRIRFDEAVEDLKTEYAVNGRRSADELERWIRLHLLPYFGGRRLAMISTADVNGFILKRQKDVMTVGDDDDRQERKYSNGEINRELTTLKRILNLARQNGKLMHVPYVPMLTLEEARSYIPLLQLEVGDRELCTRTGCRSDSAHLLPTNTSPNSRSSFGTPRASGRALIIRVATFGGRSLRLPLHESSETRPASLSSYARSIFP
jgi:hypothetical protein